MWKYALTIVVFYFLFAHCTRIERTCSAHRCHPASLTCGGPYP